MPNPEEFTEEEIQQLEIYIAAAEEVANLVFDISIEAVKGRSEELARASAILKLTVDSLALDHIELGLVSRDQIEEVYFRLKEEKDRFLADLELGDRVRDERPDFNPGDERLN